MLITCIMHEKLPLPLPSPSPSPVSDSSQPWLSPSHSNLLSVASSHMTRYGTLDAWPISGMCPSGIGEDLSALRSQGSAHDSFHMSHDLCGRHVTLDQKSVHGAVVAINHVICPSCCTGNNDSAAYPGFGGSVDIGHPRSQGPILRHSPENEQTVCGNTATLLTECCCSQIDAQSPNLGNPQSFGHGTAQAVGRYIPYGQGLAYDMMSIAGACIPPETILCHYDGCAKTFSRNADLDRHVLNVHNRVGHHCQVPGCSNNKGNGYCHPDKLKEHMWKKHGVVADLSYTKVMPSLFDLLA